MKETAVDSAAAVAAGAGAAAAEAKKPKVKRSFLNSLIHAKSKSFSAKLTTSQPQLTLPVGKPVAASGQSVALSSSLPPEKNKPLKQASLLEMKIKGKLKKQLSTTLDVEKMAALAAKSAPPIAPIVDNESTNDNASNVSSNDTIKPSAEDDFSDIYPVSLSSAASSNLSIIEASKMKKKIFSKPIKTAFVKGASFSSTSMSSSPPSSSPPQPPPPPPPPLPMPTVLTTATASSNYINNLNKHTTSSNKLVNRSPAKTLSIDSQSTSLTLDDFQRRVNTQLQSDDTENSENCEEDDEEEDEESVGSNDEMRRKNMQQQQQLHHTRSVRPALQPSPLQALQQRRSNQPAAIAGGLLRKRSRSRSKSRLVHSLNSKATAGVCAASNAWSLNTDYDEEDFMDAFKVRVFR